MQASNKADVPYPIHKPTRLFYLTPKRYASGSDTRSKQLRLEIEATPYSPTAFIDPANTH
jgi:hypothetical protein